jgi:hypothetical protein
MLFGLALFSSLQLARQFPLTVESFPGAPFSGESVVERIIVTSDGKLDKQPPQITRVYRDAAGRLRLDMFGPAGTAQPPSLITVMDPVTGYDYRLEAGTNVVRRMFIGIRENGSGLPLETPLFLPPTPSQQLPASQSCVRTTSEVLPSQLIDGVLSDGSRTTAVYPAGCQGAPQESIATSELWGARKLRVILRMESLSRTGQTTITMQNLSLTEPDPRLFETPPGYPIVDQPHPAP